MGGEPGFLASQLLQIAQQAGCETRGVNQGVGFPAFTGLLVKYSPENTPEQTVQGIISALRQAGIDCNPIVDDSQPSGSIYLYVGYKP